MSISGSQERSASRSLTASQSHCSSLLFLATAILVAKGGTIVGPTLALLGQYLPGYTVTPAGSVLVLGYGFVVGGLLGWTFAVLRNTVLLFYIAIVRRRAEWGLLRRFLEFV